MIVLFSDFGVRDPYVGQIKARLALEAPGVPVVDLLHEVPDFEVQAGAHLLAAFAGGFPSGTVFMTVVDPGVGTTRDAVVVMAGARWYVGPDNGLLSVVAQRATDARIWRIDWRPPELSASFHGTDLFSVVAAEIARGEFPTGKLTAVDTLSFNFVPDDWPYVIYIDHYGNAWTGLRRVSPDARVSAAGKTFTHGESFGFVGRGEGFWFMNSVGLLELAVNRGSAAGHFGISVGDAVLVGDSEK